MRDELNPLAGLRPITPPVEMRARTLAAAHEALARGSQPRDRWTWIVENRAVRLAWAASVIALLLGHLALSAPDGPTSPPTRLTPRFADRSAPEVIELATLTAIDAGALPSLGSPRRRKENGS